MELLDVLFLPMRKRVATAELAAAKLRVGHEILKLASETRAAFYENQGNDQLGEIGQTASEASGASADAALRLNEAGNTKTLDLANEAALHMQAKLDFAKAQALAVESREKLNKLMGVWGDQTNWKAANRLPDPPSSEIGARGLESRAI
ncbi:MAG TPA: hypothetical protein VF511_06560, partial [Chthoniobacterales bacterium]